MVNGVECHPAGDSWAHPGRKSLYADRPRGNWMRYRADIAAGAIKLRESRVIADLLLRETDAVGWRGAILEENLLQSRNAASAKRLTTLIRGRLGTMGPGLWRLVRDESATVATH